MMGVCNYGLRVVKNLVFILDYLTMLIQIPYLHIYFFILIGKFFSAVNKRCSCHFPCTTIFIDIICHRDTEFDHYSNHNMTCFTAKDPDGVLLQCQWLT